MNHLFDENETIGSGRDLWLLGEPGIFRSNLAREPVLGHPPETVRGARSLQVAGTSRKRQWMKSRLKQILPLSGVDVRKGHETVSLSRGWTAEYCLFQTEPNLQRWRLSFREPTRLVEVYP